MAAATVTGAQRAHVFGDRRYRGANSIAFASNGDTWTVPGIKRINALLLTPISLPPGTWYFTISGNVITLVSASGAMTFTGGAIGV
jgi:hypothetical protein